MDIGLIMIFLLIEVIGLLLLVFIVWLMHAKIGEYPEPLPLSENPKKEIKEALVFYVIFVIVLIIAVIVGIYFMLFSSGPYTLEGALLAIVFFTIPSFLLPAIYVIRVSKWNSKDLGLTTEIQQPIIFYFMIVVVIISTIWRFIMGTPTPLPLLVLLLNIYANAFLEEFLFRGIIQSKFERAMGQVKAWKWASIIFGLAYIPINFVIPIILGVDIATTIIIGCFLLAGQILSGFMFGILYTKTRNLITCIIIHYFSNFLAIIIVSIIILS